MEILLDKEYELHKFPGKGGWTYALIPELRPDKHAHFGWRSINGKIDEYELKEVKLMPMGKGQLFLSVNATIRKAIGKEEGDTVRIIIYGNEEPEVTNDDIIDCFKHEPESYDFFLSLNKKEQQAYLDWINAAVNEDQKVKRIVKAIDHLLLGHKWNSDL